MSDINVFEGFPVDTSYVLMKVNGNPFKLNMKTKTQVKRANSLLDLPLSTIVSWPGDWNRKYLILRSFIEKGTSLPGQKWNIKVETKDKTSIQIKFICNILPSLSRNMVINVDGLSQDAIEELNKRACVRNSVQDMNILFSRDDVVQCIMENILNKGVDTLKKEEEEKEKKRKL